MRKISKEEFAVAQGWKLDHSLLKYYDGFNLNVSQETKKLLAQGRYPVV